MKFKIGDKVVHPAHGVGAITRIDEKEIAGRKAAFYVLEILEKGSKIMVPVDAAARIGLRTVMSKRQAKEVIDVLRVDEVAVQSQPWNRRHREYLEMLNSGSPVAVAKVFRDLSRLRSDKELSFSERQLLDQARSLLVTELALAQRCEESRVEAEIQSILA